MKGGSMQRIRRFKKNAIGILVMSGFAFLGLASLFQYYVKVAENVEYVQTFRVVLSDLESYELEAESTQRLFALHLLTHGQDSPQARDLRDNRERALATMWRHYAALVQMSNGESIASLCLLRLRTQLEERIAVFRVYEAAYLAGQKPPLGRGTSTQDEVRKQIAQLNTVAEDLIAQKKQTLWRIWGVFLTILLLTILGYTAFIHTTHRHMELIIRQEIAHTAYQLELEKRHHQEQVNHNQQLHLMMKELNHRVKNSISTIAAILRLQIHASKEATIRTALTEAMVRLNAVWRVHERLYQGTDLTPADYCEAIVTDLKEALAVSINTTINAIPMPTDAATPMAIIIAEAVVNAVKYGRKDGQASVSLCLGRWEHDESHWCLHIRDHGGGFPEEVLNQTGKSKSLGMKVLHGLAVQLNAKLHLKNDDGAVIELIGPLPGEAT
jgi:two-component sensor histidine kinase